MARPLGSINRNKTEAAIRAREIVEDPKYREELLKRAIAGTLAPAVELMLFYYAYGRPVERVITEMNVSVELAELTDEQLAARAELVAHQMRRLRQPDALPGEVVDANDDGDGTVN